MAMNPIKPEPGTKAQRTADALFGIFFIVLAVAILVAGSESTLTGALVAAIVVGGLGVDALVNAARNKRSLISRIGPLP